MRANSSNQSSEKPSDRHRRRTQSRHKAHPRPQLRGLLSMACAIPECGKPPVNKRGWCSKHYQRWRKHGDPVAGKPEGADPGAGQAEIERAAKDASPEKCWLWPFGATGSGYGHTTYRGKHVLAHRTVCELVHGEPPRGSHAAHNCGNSLCVNPHHLRWATPRQNNADKLSHDTHNRGQRHNLAKLSEADVLEIRRLAAAGPINKTELAKRFGVTRTAIYAATKGINWKWLEECA